MQIGDICNFRIDQDNHICKVEIMNFAMVWSGQENGGYSRQLFTCRRINNGSIVLAWEEDLKKLTEKR
jgi:hypothetical protein